MLYEAWVDSWAAPPGVPAHVTLLYPFLPRADDELVAELRSLFASVPAFEFGLARIERFPDGTAWLAPEPPEPFVALTRTIVERFPAYPPYGGAHDEIVPHLTIAQGEGELLARVEAGLAGLEPIDARADEVALLERGEDGVWCRRGTFRLGT